MKEVICLGQAFNDRWFITKMNVDSDAQVTYYAAGAAPLISDNGEYKKDRKDITDHNLLDHCYFDRRRAIQIMKKYFPNLEKFESRLDHSIKKIK